jgi:ribonuclease P protein component
VVLDAPGVTGPARLAVVAGKAVGSAVKRNRAKRRLREAVARVPVRDGRDYIVIATSAAVNRVAFADLVGWVAEAVRGQGDASA